MSLGSYRPHKFDIEGEPMNLPHVSTITSRQLRVYHGKSRRIIQSDSD